MKTSPTVAGLATNTLKLPEYAHSTVEVLNAERDASKHRVWDQLAIEFQLAHVDGSVRALYDRDPLMEERERLMQHWADKLDTLRKGAEIIPLAARTQKS